MLLSEARRSSASCNVGGLPLFSKHTDNLEAVNRHCNEKSHWRRSSAVGVAIPLSSQCCMLWRSSAVGVVTPLYICADEWRPSASHHVYRSVIVAFVVLSLRHLCCYSLSSRHRTCAGRLVVPQPWLMKGRGGVANSTSLLRKMTAPSGLTGCGRNRVLLAVPVAKLEQGRMRSQLGPS